MFLKCKMTDKTNILAILAKINSDIPEIRERAVGNLYSKFVAKIISPTEVPTQFPDAPGLLLGWINDAQESASLDSLSKGLKILEAFAQVHP